MEETVEVRAVVRRKSFPSVTEVTPYWVLLRVGSKRDAILINRENGKRPTKEFCKSCYGERGQSRFARKAHTGKLPTHLFALRNFVNMLRTEYEKTPRYQKIADMVEEYITLELL